MHLDNILPIMFAEIKMLEAKNLADGDNEANSGIKGRTGE